MVPMPPFGLPCAQRKTTLPRYVLAFLMSFSRSDTLAVAISASTPLAGVDPVQPMAATVSLRGVGARIEASATPRVHPFHTGYFSARTFSSPMDFILARPQWRAFWSWEEPVSRAPMSSLSSVRYSNAWEFIAPFPAILTNPALVLSPSALLGEKCSLAKVQFAATIIAARTSNRLFIRALSEIFLFTAQSSTLTRPLTRNNSQRLDRK